MTFASTGGPRLIGLALGSLLLSSCALPQERKIADAEAELAPARQAFLDCGERISKHYAKTEAAERDIIRAGETLCGSKLRAIREKLFDLSVERRAAQRYLNEVDTDLRVIVLRTVRAERRKLQDAKSD